jgi:hypothetical protein
MRGLGLVRVGQLDARALDAANPPMRYPHRALSAPVRYPQEGEEGRYEGDERDDDLQPAHELVGHVGSAMPNKKPAIGAGGWCGSGRNPLGPYDRSGAF